MCIEAIHNERRNNFTTQILKESYKKGGNNAAQISEDGK
jgi:hypothetical protein